MRQKRIVTIGPENFVEALNRFACAASNDRFPPPFQRSFEKSGQYAFKRRALEVIEEHFGHDGLLTTDIAAATACCISPPDASFNLMRSRSPADLF